MFYITEQALRLEPFNIKESDADKETIEFLLEVSKDFIDTHTRQSFEKDGTTENPTSILHDGNDKRGLAVAKRIVKLISISKILTDTSLQTFMATDFVVSRAGYFVEWKELTTTSSSSRVRKDIFDWGVGNIDIKAVWGWEEVPAMIKYLQGRLIEIKIKTGSFTAINQSESLGDLSYQTYNSDDAITGILELDTIIRKYRRFKFNGAV